MKSVMKIGKKASAAGSVYSNDEQAAWLSKIQSKQSEKMTPEMKERIKTKAAVQQRRTMSSLKAQKMDHCSKKAMSSWASGMVKAKAASASPAPLRAACYQAGSAMMVQEMEAIGRSMSNQSDEALLEELDVEEEPEAVEESELQSLLKEVKAEPADDEERSAKFLMYEKYLETVSKLRDETLAFWQGCQGDIPTATRARLSKAVAAIDGERNMSADFRDGEWFVYAMASVAAGNNAKIARLLGDMRSTLDALAKEDDCPICLELLGGPGVSDTVVLSCCHKVCEDCWDHWRAVRGGGGYCPLCRHEEFLTDLESAARR